MMSRKTKLLLLISGTGVMLAALLLLKDERIKKTLFPLRIKSVSLVRLPENRLRFKVLVNTSGKCDAVIKYWARGSKDTLYSSVSANSSDHTLWIVNTIARTDYRFCIEARTGAEKVRGKTHRFETHPVYQATPYFTLEQLDRGFAPEMKDKFFLTQILTEPGSAVIIDHLGNIVWYEAFRKGVKVSHWTDQRTILCITGAEKIPSSGGDEIVEIDLAGKIISHLQFGKGDMDKLVHHEVRKDEKGNIYALTFDKRAIDLSSAGGSQTDTVHADGIVVFNPAGKKIWEWSALDHLDPLKDPNILKNKKDMVHANSVFKTTDGNFLISFRDLNQIWQVDHPSGKVIWKFGEKGDFPLDTADYFSAQHFGHINEKNDLMILDNGVKKEQTRALSFHLDDGSRQSVKHLDIPLPRDYYTTAKGNAELFGHDKVLFCVTDPRCFLITDFNGKILWKVQVGGDPYRLEEAVDFLYPQPEI